MPQLYYMSPNNAHWLDENATAEAEALGLKDHLLSDEHVGGGGGVSVAKKLFGAFPNQTFGACNAETNAGTHHVTRMLREASDLNDWLSHPIPSTSGDAGSRLKFRTASFCTERSGHFDAWDQVWRPAQLAARKLGRGGGWHTTGLGTQQARHTTGRRLPLSLDVPRLAPPQPFRALHPSVVHC
jgi:hypothetical protein